MSKVRHMNFTYYQRHWIRVCLHDGHRVLEDNRLLLLLLLHNVLLSWLCSICKRLRISELREVLQIHLLLLLHKVQIGRQSAWLVELRHEDLLLLQCCQLLRCERVLWLLLL